jgi:hypothetical protein
MEKLENNVDSDVDTNKRVLNEDNPTLIFLASGQLPSDHIREWYIIPRSQHWAETMWDPTQFSDQTFQETFRMSRTSFNHLHAILQPYIMRQDTRFRPAVPSKRRLAIFLYHTTLGVCYKAVTNQFGHGTSTISDIVGQVAEAICKHMTKRYIRFPSPDEARLSMEFWNENNHVPGVVGCIDGTHIPISRPCVGGNVYFNRKSQYSINVQGTRCLSPFN